MKELIKYLCMIIIICCTIFGTVHYSLHDKVILLDSDDMMIEYDAVGGISCASDSMGLTLDCSEKAFYQYVEKYDSLELGKIYVYDNPEHNNSVIHRLVGCVDVDCNLTIFKGDNNALSENIPRDWIVRKLVRIDYE